MKFLLFGKDGQVGWELQRSLAVLGDVVALGRGDRGGDLSALDEVSRVIRAQRPDVIVNAAAYTAVDKAEAEAGIAAAVNAAAPAAMAREAAALGALLVHYSTDYVFDGSGQRPWKEADPVGPLNVYGRTKLDGEQAVVSGCPRHLVFRTSWVYSARGGNFPRTMLRLAGERERLSVIDDQTGAPTGADLLADATAHAVARTVVEPSLSGLYHLAAAGETTWNGYARFVLARAAHVGIPLKAGPEAVDRVPTSAFPTPARRPLNSRLDTGKFRHAFGLALAHWHQGVARLVEEIK